MLITSDEQKRPVTRPFMHGCGLIRRRRHRTTKSMNILVVDNEIILAESMKIGLQARGHLVIATYSAPEALGHLFDGGRRIDMVITDYLMPGMDGIDLLAAIRKVAPALPVILMTAYGETNLISEALRSNCDGFLEKPFRLEQLMHKIEEIGKWHLRGTTT